MKITEASAKRALASAMWDMEDDRQSCGFDAQEPAAGDGASTAGGAHDVRSLVSARQRRRTASGTPPPPPSDDSVRKYPSRHVQGTNSECIHIGTIIAHENIHATTSELETERSRVPAPLPAEASGSGNEGIYIRKIVIEPGMSNADIEKHVLSIIPKDIHARIRFRHNGPGNRFRECDLCRSASNLADPVYGDAIYIIWAHKDADTGDISGYICVHCGYTIRRRYKGASCLNIVLCTFRSHNTSAAAAQQTEPKASNFHS